jgi:ATP-dependent DNA helicase RecG
MVPPVRAVFTLTEYEGELLCSAEIPAVDLSERPCYYSGSGRIQGSYVRVGDADLHMTDYEIYCYEAFRRHLHDDERPVERATEAVLDKNLVDEYIRNRQKDRPGFSKLTPAQTYDMLAITRGGHPTVAAIMNMGVYPQGYFPQWGITAIVVPGKEIGDVAEDHARFLDNKRIEGTICTMAEEAQQFCLRNMKVRTIIDPPTGKRTDRTEYPQDAIREAILNALIHRDYSFYTEGTPVQINFFADRLEIHSPGSLYGRMTVEQLGYAKMDLRNPALAVMAEAITGSENRYSGIPTIQRAMRDFGLKPPEFINVRGTFTVILYNNATPAVNSPLLLGGMLTDKEEELIRFLKVPRTRQEIADHLRIGTVQYAIQAYIKPLIDKGRVKMTIPERPRSQSQKFYTAGVIDD